MLKVLQAARLQVVQVELAIKEKAERDGLKIATFNTTTGQVSLLFTQYLSHDESWNILFDAEASMMVLGLLLIGLVYFAVPRHKEWSQ